MLTFRRQSCRCECVGAHLRPALCLVQRPLAGAGRPHGALAARARGGRVAGALIANLQGPRTTDPCGSAVSHLLRHCLILGDPLRELPLDCSPELAAVHVTRHPFGWLQSSNSCVFTGSADEGGGGGRGLRAAAPAWRRQAEAGCRRCGGGASPSIGTVVRRSSSRRRVCHRQRCRGHQ
jgi:hypothetical protein